MKRVSINVQRRDAALRVTVRRYRIGYETEERKVAVSAGGRQRVAAGRQFPWRIESKSRTQNPRMKFVQFSGRQCGADVERKIINVLYSGPRRGLGKRARHETIQRFGILVNIANAGMMPIAEMVIKFAIELIEVISRAASPRVAADVEPVTESIVIGSGHHVEQSVDYSRSVDPQTIRIAAENI